MPILPIRLEAVAHIPHGSGDAEYHLIDADADNSDVIAIIDPQMIMDDPAALAERLALASNSHYELIMALKATQEWLTNGHRGAYGEPVPLQSMLEVIGAALATAREG